MICDTVRDVVSDVVTEVINPRCPDVDEEFTLGAKAYFIDGLAQEPFYLTPASAGSFSAGATATVGSETITLDESEAEMGSGYFAMVAEYEGVFAFIPVFDVSGTTVNLEENIETYLKNAPDSGNLDITLHFRFQAATGIHLTTPGNKAWAEHIFQAQKDPLKLYRGSARMYVPVGAEFNTGNTGHMWQAISTPVIQYGDSINMFNTLNGVVDKTAQVATAIGTNATNEGFEITFNVNKQDVVVQFILGARPFAAASRLSYQVVFKADGVTIRTDTQYHSQKLYSQDFSGVDAINIEITQLHSGSIARENYISEIFVLEKPTDLIRPLEQVKNIVLLGDSFMDPAYSTSGEFRSYLQSRLPGKRIIDRGPSNEEYAKQSMTSTYGVAWLDYIIETEKLTEKPSTILCNYMINDYSSINGTVISNVTDPDGATLDPNVGSYAEYFSNISLLKGKCLNAGINFVHVYPLVPSTTSIQNHANNMRQGLINPKINDNLLNQPNSTEISDQDSYFNQYEKQIGRRIWDITNSRYMSATGSSATSTWEPETVGTAVTPA